MSVTCTAIGELGTPFASLPYPVMVMHNRLGVLSRHGLEYFGNRKEPRESTDGAAHISRSGQGTPRSRTIGSAADPCWLSGLGRLASGAGDAVFLLPSIVRHLHRP
jgi:hypothetical protein